MVQILSPTRLMPGGLSFINSNQAIKGYAENERLRMDQAQEGRQSERHGWEKEDRANEAAYDAAAGEAVSDALQAPPTINPPPAAPTTPLTPPQPQPRPGLSGITSAPIMPAAAPQAAPPTAAAAAPVTPPAAPGPQLDATATAAMQREMAENPPAQGLSAITSGAQPQKRPNIGMSMAGKLAGKKGQGRAALSHYQAGQQQTEGEHATALKILELAEAGQVEQAMMLARQSGEEIDPRVLQDGKARRNMRTTLEMAKFAGAEHDPAWMEKFMQSYSQSGDLQTALAAAGKPVAVPKKANTYKPVTIVKRDKTKGPKGEEIVSERRVHGAMDTTTGDFSESELEAPTPTGAGGREAALPADARLAEWGIKNKVWADAKTAFAAIRQARSNPNQIGIEKAKMAGRLLENTMESGVNRYTTAKQAALRAEGKDDEAAAWNDVKSAQAMADEVWKGVGAAESPMTAPEDEAPAEQRVEGEGVENGQPVQIYTIDGGQSWWHVDGDTPYTGDFEDD